MAQQQQKQGAKGQKIGRNKRRPCYHMQAYRTAANRDRRIKKAERDRQAGSGRIHPSARERNRAARNLSRAS